MNAWLYALPLIETAGARARATQAQQATPNGGINHLGHAAKLAGPTDRAITTPNSDTLYSSGFVDLTRGPVTLVIPDAGTRYQSVAIMDMYTNNNVVLGKRTARRCSRHLALARSRHHARRAAATLVIATPHAWVLGRTLVLGPADLASRARSAAKPITFRPCHTAAARRPRHGRRRGPTIFGPLCNCHAATRHIGWRALPRSKNLQQAGKQHDFAAAGYAPAQSRSHCRRRGARAGDGATAPRIKKISLKAGPIPVADLGQFGDDYIFRAVVAVAGLAALPRQEAMYMNAARRRRRPVHRRGAVSPASG